MPAVNSCSPRMTRSRLVFPDPLAPSTAMNSPGLTSIEVTPEISLSERQRAAADLQDEQRFGARRLPRGKCGDGWRMAGAFGNAHPSAVATAPTFACIHET